MDFFLKYFYFLPTVLGTQKQFAFKLHFVLSAKIVYVHCEEYHVSNVLRA